MSIFWLYNLRELIISKTKNSSIKLSAGSNVFFLCAVYKGAKTLLGIRF